MKNKLLLIVLLLVVPFVVEAKSKKKSKKGEVVTQETVKESAYEKFFKGKKCDTRRGLFDLHKMGGKVYFEIPEKMLERGMLLGSTISEITDNQFGSVGEKPFYPLHVMFTKTDSTLNLCLVNTDYTTKEGNVAERIKTSKMPTVMGRFPVKVYNGDSTSFVIDVTDFLLADTENLHPFSPYAIALGRTKRIEKEFKKENSFIAEIKAFEDNVSVQSSLNYSLSLRDQNYYYLFKVPFTAVMTRSFVLLPEEEMKPRIADPRINIFYHQRTEISNESRGLLPVFYAYRWRVEPKDELKYRNGELVEPKEPIVFYVDNSFPEGWKKYIKLGIEDWNMAFEKIGFKNVLQARDFPTDDADFDPDNLKYSCVRYSPSPVPNAMGPSWIDPRTGEIINASVYVFHNLLELVQSWRFIQTSAADPDMRKVVADEEIMGDCIRYVIAHEVGHCLGFMHNMSASAAIPVDSLRSPSFTQKYGTTYSIMDYARNNYVAQPGDKEKGVKLTPPKMGLYDEFSVKWLYTAFYGDDAKDEYRILTNWITEKSGDLRYRYGKQQLMGYIDPTSLDEDLGDDAMKAAAYGIKNLKYIMANMDDWLNAEDKDYQFRKKMYGELVNQYVRYLNHVLVNVGGIYLNEVYAGDALPAYQSVPRERQKAAVRFILEQMKDMAWLDNQKVLQNFDLASNKSAEIEDAVFRGMMSRQAMINISASKTEKNPYSSKEFVNDLYEFIFRPTRQGRRLNETDRKFQNRFVSQLITGSGAAATTINGQPLTVANPHGIIEYEGMPDVRNNGEIQWFGFNVSITTVNVQLNHIYYDKLLQVRQLIDEKKETGDSETRLHYKLLLHKINQALKI